VRDLLRKTGLLLLVVTIVGAIVAVDAFRRDLGAAAKRIAAGSELAVTPCGPIEYAVAGEGEPLLVVHGAGGGFDQGLVMSERLVARGFRAVSVSRFGYLGTPMPADASPGAQADAHACLLDALDLDRVSVLGASAGAPSSLALAIRHPERVAALVVLVPATWMPGADRAGTEVPEGLEPIFDTALRWNFPLWLASRAARDRMIGIMLGTPPALLESASVEERHYVDRMLRYVMPVTRRREGLLNDGVVTTAMERFELERIEAPTLVISARDDLYGTYERARYTASAIPDARFVGYEDGGHLLVGRQQAVTDEITAFLNAAQSSRAESAGSRNNASASEPMKRPVDSRPNGSANP